MCTWQRARAIAVATDTNEQDLTCTRQNPPGAQEVEIIVCRVEVLVGSVTGI